MTGLLFLLIGIGILGSGILTILVIQRAGSDYFISLPFFEKPKLLMIQDAIEEGLVHDTDKIDLGLYFDKK